ncbi:MAG: tetratricopeptide repeat protein [Pseudomonadota bacterium]
MHLNSALLSISVLLSIGSAPSATFAASSLSELTAPALEAKPSDHDACTSRPGDEGFSSEKALAACEKIIESGEATGTYLAQTYNNRGVELERGGDLRAAEEDYRRAVSIDADYAIGWNNLSEVLSELHRYEEAIAAAEAAIAVEDADDWGYQNRAYALRRLGRVPEARKDLNTALLFDPDNTWSHRESGYLHSENGEHDLALASFRRAYDLDPEDTNSQYGLAYGLDDAGEYRDALDLLDRSIATNPTTDLVNLRGLIYTDRSDDVRDLGRGIADLEWVVEEDSEYAMAVYNLSRAYALDMRPEDALRLLRNGLSLEVRPGQARDIIGALFRRGAPISAAKAARMLADAD